MELSCVLPACYPVEPPTQVAVREGQQPARRRREENRQVLTRAAADDLQTRLGRHLDGHCPPGEQRLFEAVRWLQSNAAASFVSVAVPPGKDSQVRTVC